MTSPRRVPHRSQNLGAMWVLDRRKSRKDRSATERRGSFNRSKQPGACWWQQFPCQCILFVHWATSSTLRLSRPWGPRDQTGLAGLVAAGCPGAMNVWRRCRAFLTRSREFNDMSWLGLPTSRRHAAGVPSLGGRYHDDVALDESGEFGLGQAVRPEGLEHQQHAGHRSATARPSITCRHFFVCCDKKCPRFFFCVLWICATLAGSFPSGLDSRCLESQQRLSRQTGSGFPAAIYSAPSIRTRPLPSSSNGPHPTQSGRCTPHGFGRCEP